MDYVIDIKADEYPNRFEDCKGYIARLKRKMGDDFSEILVAWTELANYISEEDKITETERTELLFGMAENVEIIEPALMDWLKSHYFHQSNKSIMRQL